MSMEVNVFFSGKLPSTASLTRCFKELGFPLTFPRGTGALEKHGSGYLPMRFRGEESGIEFYTHDSREELEEDFEIDIDPRFTRSANFRWSSDANECVVAFCFAGALATLVSGAVLDVDGETILTAEETIARARKDLKDTVPPPKQRAARPADIRHYLKPLLEQRGDLVLVGRMLLVRPVRHLLRGAFFDRTSDRYELRIWRYIVPLYKANPDRLGYGNDDHPPPYAVWQPHFVPLMMDTLAKQVFARFDTISSLSDFAAQQSGKRRSFEAGLTSLFLSGASEQADEYLARLSPEARSNKDVQSILLRVRERFLREPKQAVAEFHAKEAAAVKALKLEHVWDPAPFAMEVPADERAFKTNEPVFVSTPWPSRPAWLWQEIPREPGEVRYAKDLTYRDDNVQLLVALTPVEADERHRMRETYVLAARLPDGLLALVRYSTLYDRNSPDDRKKVRDEPDISISLYGQAHVAHTHIWSSERTTGACHITRFDVRDRATSREWRCLIDLEENTKTVWDDRSGERIYAESAPTEAEREAAVCPIPMFGEYMEVVERFRAVLRVTGFGEVS
jgi:hypothetical protein